MREESIRETKPAKVLLQELKGLNISEVDEINLFIRDVLSPYFKTINDEFTRIYEHADSGLMHHYIAFDLLGCLPAIDSIKTFTDRLERIINKIYTKLDSEIAEDVSRLASLSSATQCAKKIDNLINDPDAYINAAGEEYETDSYLMYLVSTLLPMLENPKESLKVRCLIVDVFSSDAVASRLREDPSLAEYAKAYLVAKNDLLFLKLTKRVLDRDDFDLNKLEDQQTAIKAFLNVVNPYMRRYYSVDQKWHAYRALFIPKIFVRLENLSFTDLLYQRVLCEVEGEKSLTVLLNDFKASLIDAPMRSWQYQTFDQVFSKVIKEKFTILEYAMDIVEAAASLSTSAHCGSFYQIAHFSPSTSERYDSRLVDACESYKEAEKIIERISRFYDTKVAEFVKQVELLKEALQQKGDHSEICDHFEKFMRKLSKKTFVERHFESLVTLAKGETSEESLMTCILDESLLGLSFGVLIDRAERALPLENASSFFFSFSKQEPKNQREKIRNWIKKNIETRTEKEIAFEEAQKRDNPFYDIDLEPFIEAVSAGVTFYICEDVNRPETVLSKGKAEEVVGAPDCL